MTRVPKATLLTTGLDKGGAETQLVRLARYLRGRGWHVRVISLLRPEAFVEDLETKGIPVSSLAMDRGVPNPFSVYHLSRMLARNPPDVLVTFMYHANVLGRIAGRLAQVPRIVGSIRNESFGGRWRDRVERWTERLSDATTTNSQLAAASLLERGIGRRGRLHVIPNGIPVEDFDPGRNSGAAMLREQMGLAKDDFVWLAVGHLEEQKDYPSLFEAFRTLSSGGARVKLLVAGKGSLDAPLSNLAKSLRIDDDVAMLGMRSDVPLLLRASDAYVMSSAWEGMPNAVMEALAAARPVVATGVGGVPELVQEGVSGFLVHPGDPAALAGAMRRVTELSCTERAAMGLHGKSHIQQHYNMEEVMRKWEEFLLSLLPEQHSRVGSH